MKDFHFDAISAFENYEIEKMRDGHVVVTTKVVNSSLNYYGNAHGGYLFTLCDQISGLVVISLGLVQSSINYLKAGKLDDVLTIKGECVHQGRTTCVMDVDITNQEGRNVCKATFTMFVTDQRSEERRVSI
ncbi:TPA: PaaI family thioesterase [Streptococcus pneumoniae]